MDVSFVRYDQRASVDRVSQNDQHEVRTSSICPADKQILTAGSKGVSW